MNDRFIILYELNLKQCKPDYLTENELGHEIARLMRYGACGVQIVILDSNRLNEKTKGINSQYFKKRYKYD